MDGRLDRLAVYSPAGTPWGGKEVIVCVCRLNRCLRSDLQNGRSSAVIRALSLFSLLSRYRSSEMAWRSVSSKCPYVTRLNKLCGRQEHRVELCGDPGDLHFAAGNYGCLLDNDEKGLSVDWKPTDCTVLTKSPQQIYGATACGRQVGHKRVTRRIPSDHLDHGMTYTTDSSSGLPCEAALSLSPGMMSGSGCVDCRCTQL